MTNHGLVDMNRGPEALIQSGEAADAILGSTTDAISPTDALSQAVSLRRLTRIEDPAQDPELLAEQAAQKEKLMECLDELPYRKGEILKRRFGLEDREHPETLEEVGRVFSISDTRVSQIQQRTLFELYRSPSVQALRFSDHAELPTYSSPYDRMVSRIFDGEEPRLDLLADRYEYFGHQVPPMQPNPDAYPEDMFDRWGEVIAARAKSVLLNLVTQAEMVDQKAVVNMITHVLGGKSSPIDVWLTDTMCEMGYLTPAQETKGFIGYEPTKKAIHYIASYSKLLI